MLAMVGAAACSGPADVPGGAAAESTGSTHEAIMGGAEDTATGGGNDAVVALRIGDASPYQLCTGALVAPNVVLTARHCVSQDVSATVVCNEKGESTNGAQVGDDRDPSTVWIYTGANPTFTGTPAAHAKQFFHPATNVLCDSDIALVVLDAAIDGVTPMELRLDGGVRPGETVRAVGYGKNDEGFSTGTRMHRPGVGVLAIGAGVSKSQTALATHEFEVGTSICQGDSGGPAISEATGAVVGVVSRGGDCSDDFGHIYVQTTGWQPLFRLAFAAAGGSPAPEQGTPRPAAASPGGDDGSDPTAPGGASSGGSVGTPASSAPRAGGCAAAPGGGAGDAPAGLLALGAAAAALIAGRRRRRAR